MLCNLPEVTAFLSAKSETNSIIFRKRVSVHYVHSLLPFTFSFLIKTKSKTKSKTKRKIDRGDRIRTCDLYVPNGVAHVQ